MSVTIGRPCRYATVPPHPCRPRIRPAGQCATAVVAIDGQAGVVAGTHERDTVVANIYRLVDKARRVQVPVVWVQHSDEQLLRGSDGWQIDPELAPGDGE